MIEGLSASLSALNAFSRQVENSSNNLANLQTAGYKSRQVVQQTGSQGGTQIAGMTTSLESGGLMQTGNPLDMSIIGQGFFSVSLPNGGTGYTRQGSFSKNAQGLLVDMNGNPVQPPVTIPGNATAISVDKAGVISAMIDGNANALGQLNLSLFQNPGGLDALGGNLYVQSHSSGAPVSGFPGTGGRGEILGGYLEMSNVDIAKENVNLMLSSAGFKASTKAIKTQEEMIGSILDLKT